MFQERLKKLRKEKKLTQANIAKSLNITPEAYTQYERGKRQPNIENLVSLAKFFNVSVDYLLGLSEYKNIEEIKQSLKNEYITEEEKQLILLYRKLPEKLKAEIKGEIKGILKVIEEQAAVSQSQEKEVM